MQVADDAFGVEQTGELAEVQLARRLGGGLAVVRRVRRGAAVDRGAVVSAVVVTGIGAIAQVAGKGLMGRVMSTVGMALVLGPAIGPSLGGFLIAHASWPWLFVINVPVGLVGLWFGSRVLPKQAGGQRSPFDVPGFVLIGLGLPVLTYVISQSGAAAGPSVGWLVVLGVAGAALLVWFAVRCARRPESLLRVRLFGNPVFAAAALSSFCAGLLQFGVLVVWALYFQFVRGYSLTEAGVAMIGFALGSAALPVAGRLTDRWGGGAVAFGGAVLSVAALVPVVVLPGGADLWVLEILLVLLGIGNAFSVVPSSTAGYTAIEPAAIPDAVTQINILLRFGGAVGTALVVAVLGAPAAGVAAPPSPCSPRQLSSRLPPPRC
ncbi:MFS transporter [Amycolatopsis sp. NPDC004368]